MEYAEVALRFRQLTANKQIDVLAAFGLNLTIVARDTSVVAARRGAGESTRMADRHAGLQLYGRARARDD
jgi:hypothetical protein